MQITLKISKGFLIFIGIVLVILLVMASHDIGYKDGYQTGYSNAKNHYKGIMR